jgi:hypothetical protein
VQQSPESVQANNDTQCDRIITRDKVEACAENKGLGANFLPCSGFGHQQIGSEELNNGPLKALER